MFIKVDKSTNIFLKNLIEIMFLHEKQCLSILNAGKQNRIRAYTERIIKIVFHYGIFFLDSSIGILTLKWKLDNLTMKMVGV